MSVFRCEGGELSRCLFVEVKRCPGVEILRSIFVPDRCGESGRSGSQPTSTGGETTLCGGGEDSGWGDNIGR